MNLHHPPGGLSPASGVFAFLPPAATPKAFKEALGDEIERMIDMLDALDGDPDYEPSLARFDGDGSDREGDDADLELSGDENEPSLGSLGSSGFAYREQAWAGGTSDDCERDDADDEDGGDTELNGDELDGNLAGSATELERDEADAEPSLGSFDRMTNQENWSPKGYVGMFVDNEVDMRAGPVHGRPSRTKNERADHDIAEARKAARRLREIQGIPETGANLRMVCLDGIGIVRLAG